MTHPVITPDILLNAYRIGVFPMAESRGASGIHWMRPNLRGVFDLGAFHISRSLRAQILRGGYDVAINRDFAGVVAACADRPQTWINAESIIYIWNCTAWAMPTA